MIVVFVLCVAPSLVKGAAAEEDQTAMLRLAADAARANAQAINGWIGEASFLETSKTEGREPQVTRMEINFVFDRREGAIRNRVIRHGPHVYVTPDGRRENSDADLTLDLMRKAGAYLSVNKLKNDGAGPDRRILVVSPRLSGFHKLGFLDPISYFSTSGQQAAWDQLDIHLKRPGGLAQNVSTEGRKVFLTFRSGQSVNRYTYDLTQAGNLVQFFAESDDGGNKSTRDIRIDYETINKVVVPKRWSEELKSRTLTGQAVSMAKEVKFAKNVVNQPIDPREVSIEAMGIKPGDVIRDERTNQTFEYTGKPLSMPTTAPVGAMLDGAGAIELPRSDRADPTAGTAGNPSAAAKFWPGLVAIAVVAIPLFTTWRQRGRPYVETQSMRTARGPGLTVAVWAWVPRVVGALFILAATTKAADPLGIKQVLTWMTG